MGTSFSGLNQYSQQITDRAPEHEECAQRKAPSLRGPVLLASARSNPAAARAWSDLAKPARAAAVIIGIHREEKPSA